MRQLYSATWLFSRVHDVALARFLLARAFVWVSLALAPGCSIQLTEKAPAVSQSDEVWLVHCETAVSHRPSDTVVNKGVSKPRWLVALDSTGTPIHLRGHLEDGFLVLNEEQPTENALRLGCIAAVEASTTPDDNEVARIQAFREHERVNVAIVFAEAADESPVQRLIVIGDSLSDTGNLKSRLRVFPASPYWIGRFSNGPMWPDYIDALSKLSVQNHAVGGASVTGKDTMPKGTLMEHLQDGGQLFVSGTTTQQIATFENGFLLDRALVSPENTAAIIWAGANDYISKEPFTGAIETLLDRPQSKEGYLEVVQAVIARTERQLRKLIEVGFDKILVGNLPDLGLSPIVVENESYRADARLSEDERRSLLSLRLGELTSYHNKQLAIMVEQLNLERDDVTVALFDAYTLFDEVLGDTSRYHSALIATADFDPDQNAKKIETDLHSVIAQQRCYRGGYMGSRDPTEICANSNRAIFWDVVHPTTYVHCWVAYAINQRLTSLGWAGDAPALSDVGRWCARVSDVVVGHEDLRLLRYTTNEHSPIAAQ
jgi:thermolabile hemolysin